MAVLVMLTESYPLGGVTEPGFVAPEIGELAARFDKVIIAPAVDRGPQLPLPSNVEIDRSLLARPTGADKIMTLMRPGSWSRLWADRRNAGSQGKVVAAMAHTTYAHHYRRLIRHMIASRRLQLDSTLFYTFWFDAQTSALAGIPGARFVTRAHGYDIYDEANPFISHSWRREALAAMLGCYAVSAHGAGYMRSGYPGMADKIAVRRLGSAPPAASNPPAGGSDADITVLCVARISPEKRVGLLVQSLDRLAAMRPSSSFRLIHVGPGPAETVARHCTAPNLATEFRGALPNAEVHRLLTSQHFDFSALLSTSEGLPIAACESISYGVPVVATDVGGLPEIVTPDSGILLPPDPSPGHFAEVLDPMLPKLGGLRTGARRLWAGQFDARRLRSEFAAELRALADSLPGQPPHTL